MEQGYKMTYCLDAVYDEDHILTSVKLRSSKDDTVYDLCDEDLPIEAEELLLAGYEYFHKWSS